MMFITTLFMFGQVLMARPQLALAHSAETSAHVSTPAATISGHVVTDAETPLPGVVVTVQGTPHVTSTNATGDFLLPLTDTKSVLVFKCQGYRDQTVAVSATQPLTVKMYALSRAATPGSSAASGAETGGKSEVLTYSEVPPTFPGGDAAYRKFVSQNAHYPETALAKGLSGTVFVSFVVDEEGRITDAQVVRGCGNGFDEEALRVIRLMPWWNPGRVAGDAVRVSKTMAVPFVFRERP
ncbi:TonB family protein [Hymenobacter armeniacus]|uniref:TonB family protein n=1 Tax=Hymenobacter armeniacus TaxID=2771358 RepID=A0ABR8JYD8_9BACT|nr:TonB family protein [Hymenobacter armeniacus]MBD2724175.1 TonB family protein [Hymenobacter armeniacus]